MRVAVLGCGSMGTILGAYIAKAGYDVTLIDAYQAHVDALNEKGAKIIGFVDFTQPVKAITPDQLEGEYDIVFLFTKQTANDQVLPNLLPHLNEDSLVLTLQNGVPEPKVAEYVGKERTAGGTVLWSATFSEPGVSELTQDNSTLSHYFHIGMLSGEINDKIEKAREVLEAMGPTEVITNLLESRWQKIFFNGAMSGMSAAAGVTFGEVIDDPKARACASYIADEIITCAKADGIEMPDIHGIPADKFLLNGQEDFEFSQSKIHRFYSFVRGGKASMLQDLEAGRKTEVRMINGFVCDAGDRLGIETPFNDTVVEIVERIENGEETLGLHNLKYFDDAWFEYDFIEIN